LFKQEKMMIKNCSSQNEFAIINIINKEEKKLIFLTSVERTVLEKAANLQRLLTFSVVIERY